MQPIQDKDFDKLFKNAFDDAEIKPSRDLWGSIESEIEPKKKRIFPIYWLAAAAVLLVATVGFLVYQQQDTQSKQFVNYVAPGVVKPGEEKQHSAGEVATTIETATPKTPLPVSVQPITNTAKVKNGARVKPLQKQHIVTAPEMQKQETMIAAVQEPQRDLKAKIDEAVLAKTNDVVLAANPTNIKIDDVVDVSAETTDADTRNIRNVGDVVNFIVNKVDKRKDKFIQFRTDDDDSSISSINIGPFKFGKKKK
ncbi:hypothetical protein [Pedobacter sandarakinus]|uniref:hypothetical protein n=1 Tax=Pedobacter sandarakinus TaxID=353156 RepID=UPI002246E339|nr:hypothetical protein [Pedobacter sandarakinus]MCX2575812.1 hypothetical protein [Pedobacter sandarakinus]